jgi:exonuclease SbcC
VELRIAGAESALRAAASGCGIEDDEPDAIAASLDAWRRDRLEARRRAAAELAGWAELRALLGDGDLGRLESAAAQAHAVAEERGRGLDHREVAAAAETAGPPGRAEDLEQPARRARSIADDARGRLDEAARRLPSLAEAEERVAAADEELARVQRLDWTLKQASAFLEGAQERVHRDIAPVLAASLESWLPRLTGGRYTDVIVDPATLQVQLCGADRRWRRAPLLSHGTAEQVYLLLRVAMADRLTRLGEICPLLLDDVTVQFDSARTLAVLGLLHELSRDRQVVLFSQEDEVLEWAEAALDPARDRLTRLEREPPASQLRLYSDPDKLSAAR